MTQGSLTENYDWQHRLVECLPLYGHRNWIVVADSAYPAQSRPGIETIVAPAGQLDAVTAVWKAIQNCGHIRANVHTDLEMAYVAEEDAPGVSAYRQQLDKLFQDARRSQLAHEEIIARLDRAAESFRILIVKTGMTIPYTSVFFELDCGYWSAEAESRLRSAIAGSKRE